MPEINTTFTYKEVLIALRNSGWDNILPDEDALDNPDDVCVEFATTSDWEEVDVDVEDVSDDDDDEDDEDDEDDDDDEEEDSDPDSGDSNELTVPSAAVLETWKSLD